MAEIHVQQTNAFLRAYKKLHHSQKDAVDRAVADIIGDPAIGEAKKGDLSGVYVHKFDCVNQLFLLAYEYDPTTRVLLLVGTHENFYRELKHWFKLSGYRFSARQNDVTVIAINEKTGARLSPMADAMGEALKTVKPFCYCSGTN